MQTLDFTKLKKEYLTIVLPDGEKLLIGTPTKAIMSDLFATQNSLEGVKNSDIEAMDEMYRLIAKLLNRNINGVSISRERVEEMFDITDVMLIFNSYLEFIGKITQANKKN